jgi:hypothetical protein
MPTLCDTDQTGRAFPAGHLYGASRANGEVHMSTVLQWPTRPIVTLVSEFATSEAAWPLPYSSTLGAKSFSNLLRLQIEFKYKKPYGGDAKYNIFIDRKVGPTWYNVIHDVVGFENKQDTWKTSYKDYDLPVDIPLFSLDDTPYEFEFRVVAQIEGPGHMDTGSGQGSLGSWGTAYGREYKATLVRPDFHVAEARVVQLQTALQDAVEHYRKTRKQHEPA